MAPTCDAMLRLRLTFPMRNLTEEMRLVADPLITLTTDFGEGSPYVAEMKGVILSLQPAARIIDITHSIPPQDIRQGARVLEQATPCFPPGAIHVAVVDPGVGTSRSIVYAAIAGGHYVAPDNGLLGCLARRHPPTQIVTITNRRYWRPVLSSTFHGRDIMAPVAAHLSLGVPPHTLGDACEQLTPLALPEVVFENGRLVGEIDTVDTFGNLITNIDRDDLRRLGPLETLRVECCGHCLCGLRRTYGEGAPGELVALVGSHDRLEIAVVGGNAQRALAATVGEPVTVLADAPRQ